MKAPPIPAHGAEIKQRHLAASYLVLVRRERVLLLQRFQTGYQDGMYSMVAGHVGAGESFTECMVREAEEEIGITIRPAQMRTVHLMHRPGGAEVDARVDVFFAAEEWEGQIRNREPTKCSDVRRFRLDELPENMIGYVRAALDRFRAGILNSEYREAGTGGMPSTVLPLQSGPRTVDQ